MYRSFLSPCVNLLLGATLMVAPISAQITVSRTQDQMKASFDAHQGDFDYLLGDWEFTATSPRLGKAQGYWTAVRVAEGAQILDEYRIVDDRGETQYVSSTVRAYNAVLDRWELISAEKGTGLQNIGTGKKVGAEMHIEQKFNVMSENPSLWRIRYYNIQADQFSWTADVSKDDGKTWVADYLHVEARRIGPPRSLGPLTTPKKTIGAALR